MLAEDIRSAGIGSTGQILRGILKRDEDWRTKAAYHARAPMAVQRLITRRLGKRVFTDINHTRKAISIHIPKNAGTSIRTELGFHKGAHLPIARFAAEDPDATRRYYKFAIVRNPWDRLQSSFSYLRRHNVGGGFPDAVYADRYLRKFADFEQFVLSLADDDAKRDMLDFTHMLPQSYWITLPGEDRHCMDYIGRFEDLQSAFGDLAAHFRHRGKLPELNRSKPRDYRTLYTDRMRDIVAEIYASDIRAFDYTFDPAEAA